MVSRTLHFLIRLFLAHFGLCILRVRIKCGGGKLEYILKLKLVGWLSEEVVNTMRETSGVCLQGLIRVHNACSSSVSSIVLHCNGRQTFNLECCMLVYVCYAGWGSSQVHTPLFVSNFFPPCQTLTLSAACARSFSCVSHIAMLFSTLQSTFLQLNDTWQVSEMYLMRRTLHC